MLDEERHEQALLAKSKTANPPQSKNAADQNALLEGLRKHLQALTGAATDYDALLKLIGSARFTLLGQASHGTREFYRERYAITPRLITEKSFTAVAVEADWPDAWRVNRYVRGIAGEDDAASAL